MAIFKLVFSCLFLFDYANSDELYQGGVVSDNTQANNVEEDARCTNHMHSFYRMMKCEPEMTPGAPCPTSYNCPALIDRNKDQCYHEGRKYPIGTNISKDTVDLPTTCIESCQCVRLYEGVRFVCIPMSTNQTCPESTGCQRFSFAGDFPCCQDGVSSCNNGKKDSVKCMYEGHSYSEGEKIIVSKDPTCTQCICAAGFNGTISPQYCRKLSCALEFWGDAPIMLSRGCIPFYFTQEGCCPVAFRCPEPTDRVIKSKSTVSTANQSVKKCVFGNLTMAVGDRLSLWQLENGKGVNCSCTIPPLPSCVSDNFVLSDSFRREIAREGLDEIS